MPLHISECGESQLYGAPVATFDVETTGLGPKARIVQIAIVHSNLGKSNQEVVFSSLIDPGIPIPEDSSAIHGISDSDVEGKGNFTRHFPKIKAALEGRLLAAYNLPFDWRMYNREVNRCELVGELPFFGICGLVLARGVDHGLRGRGVHSLESVCGRREMEFKAHCAESDALVTSRLLGRLLREAANEYGRFGTVRDYWSWQRRRGMDQEEDYRHYLRSKGKTRGDWPWTDL